MRGGHDLGVIAMTNHANSSFLPQDYIRHKAESRSLIINLLLFGAMLTIVVGAFVVTNREESQVRAVRAQIDEQYKTEEIKVEQLRVLEAQKKNLMGRAEITASLLERVPRSFLMAELINRMPVNVTLTKIDLTSKRVIDVVKAPEAGAAHTLAQKVGLSKADPASAPPVPRPPRLEFSLVLEGLAMDDTEVADFQAALRQCPLLEHVDLQGTNEAPGEVAMRKFKLEADIRCDADVVSITPMKSERLRDSLKAGKDAGETAKSLKTLFRGGPAPAQPTGTNAPARLPNAPEPVPTDDPVLTTPEPMRDPE